VSVGGDSGLRHYTKLGAGAWTGTFLSSAVVQSSVIRVSPTNGRVYLTHIRDGDIWNFRKP
jgi:hypothetical protein